jgi:hypothetical protein
MEKSDLGELEQAMTEEEWLGNPTNVGGIRSMLHAAWARSKRRKCRLFAVACCRLIDPPIPDPRCQSAIEVAEQHADGLVTDAELAAAAAAATAAVRERFDNPAIIAEADLLAAGSVGHAAALQRVPYRSGMELATHHVVEPHPYQAAIRVCAAVLNPLTQYRGPALPRQADLLRDIFGNPFRPVTIFSSWLSSTVFTLAQGIYSEKAFDRLPVLADALKDAGCDSDDILNHFRQPGEHCRGCWALDLVLAKR